jgi:hypothetical protein
VSLPRVAWLLRMGEGRLGAGHHSSLPAIRSWTLSISAAHMTSGTPLRPGWEDDGIPARVIDELMGHEASTRGAQHLGSTMGAHYRHTTPEMATRVVAAIQARLVVVVGVAEQLVEAQPTRVPRGVF